MSWIDILFGCNHRWSWFNSDLLHVTFSDNTDKNKLTITPQVCIKCKEVQWKLIDVKGMTK